MSKRKVAIITAILIMSGLAIGSGESFTSTDDPEAATVLIKDFAFHPQTLMVEAGAIVTWLNGDSAPHRIKFPDFESRTLNKGDTFTHAFNSTGTLGYICSFHPSMRGTVVVQEME